MPIFYDLSLISIYWRPRITCLTVIIFSSYRFSGPHRFLCLRILTSASCILILQLFVGCRPMEMRSNYIVNSTSVIIRCSCAGEGSEALWALLGASFPLHQRWERLAARSFWGRSHSWASAVSSAHMDWITCRKRKKYRCQNSLWLCFCFLTLWGSVVSWISIVLSAGLLFWNANVYERGTNEDFCWLVQCWINY